MNLKNKNLLWLLYAILAALAWGIWGILTKFISADINPFTTHFMFTTGALFTLPMVIRRCKINELNLTGILIGFIAGILVILGNVSVYQSFNTGGNASVVIPFTSLYPLITIIIALVFFKEKLNWLNALGIIIVLPAIIIMSGQSQFFMDPIHSLQNAGSGTWLLFAVLALILFGFYSASQKIVAGKLTIGWSYISFLVSSSLVSLCFIISGLVDFHFPIKMFWFGSTAGFLDGLGVLAIFSSYHAGGKASKVSTIAGTLQQLFTVIMAIIFLNERIDLTILCGISLAVGGSYLLSVEKKKNP
jgi:drug/metabolite transporter (DMT)-like permease